MSYAGDRATQLAGMFDDATDDELLTDTIAVLLWQKLNERDGEYLAHAFTHNLSIEALAKRALHGLKVADVRVTAEARTMLVRAERRAKEILAAA